MNRKRFVFLNIWFTPDLNLDLGRFVAMYRHVSGQELLMTTSVCHSHTEPSGLPRVAGTPSVGLWAVGSD